MNTLTRSTALLTTAVLVVSCATSGKTTQTIEFPGYSVTIDTEWEFQGPEDFCGCIDWLDAEGRTLDSPQGSIQNGGGGGVVPADATGWRIEIVDCDEFEGCDEDTELPGSPGKNVSAAPGQTSRYVVAHNLGLDDGVMGNERSVLLDATITGGRAGDRARKWRRIVEHLAGKPLPKGVEIHSLTVAEPVFDGEPSPETFLGMRVTAYEDEVMDRFSGQNNGVSVFDETTCLNAGNGFFRIDGFIAGSDIDQDWKGAVNALDMVKTIEGIPHVARVTTSWTPSE